MKLLRTLFTVGLLIMLISGAAVAGDFEWMKDLNIKAQADPSGFKASLATRFKIGSAQIDAVISNTQKPADAYMIFRLGEMSKQPIETVMQRYRTGKGKGWGNLAKSLGIKPGSPEFHALKRGHDLNGWDGRKAEGNRKSKSHGKGHNKD